MVGVEATKVVAVAIRVGVEATKVVVVAIRVGVEATKVEATMLRVVTTRKGMVVITMGDS